VKSGGSQNSAQAPQFCVLFWIKTQFPEQHRKSLATSQAFVQFPQEVSFWPVKMQLPLQQENIGSVQFCKQPPQLTVELRVSTQSPLQHLNPLAVSQLTLQSPQAVSFCRVKMQLPLQHANPEVVQLEKQLPQFSVEFSKTQLLPQHSKLPAVSHWVVQSPQAVLFETVMIHAPLQHWKLAAVQFMPQAPQFSEEFRVSTHSKPLHLNPAVALQALLQLPQEVSFA
jgi:hypothetical protein